MNQKTLSITRLQKLLLGITLCLMTFLVFGKTSVSAASAPKCVSKQTVYYTANPDNIADVDAITSLVYIKNLSSSAKISSVTVSNAAFTAKKVAGLNAIKISLNYENEDYLGATISDLPKNAKLTFKVKQGGKTYKLSCTLTFKKQPTVIKKMTLGSKNFTSALKSHWFITAQRPSGSTAKLSITMASGYTLKYIQLTYTTGKLKRVKNGAKISLKNLSNIEVVYQVKKKPTNYKKPSSSYYKKNNTSLPPMCSYVWVTFPG